MILSPHILNIHSEYVKPSVNHSNLDMNNHFDRMEYESIYGRDIPPQQVIQPKPGDAEFIGPLPSEGVGGAGIEEASGGNAHYTEVAPSQKGVDYIKEHLSNPQFEDPTGANDMMIERIENSLANEEKLTGADANFYMHEVAERTFMENGMDYSTAHQAALDKYGRIEFDLYHPDITGQLPEWFSLAWQNYWKGE